MKYDCVLLADNATILAEDAAVGGYTVYEFNTETDCYTSLSSFEWYATND